MRTIIQLGLMILMLGTTVLANPAIADDLRTSHLLPLVGSVDSLRHAQSVGCCTAKTPATTSATLNATTPWP